MDKGTIVLDIDGTITGADHLIPLEVANFLYKLYAKGWAFIIVTGREFTYAMQALNVLEFPYYLALQNGADLLSMPDRLHLKSYYFDADILPTFESCFSQLKTDFLVYAGYERGDFCYYRPSKFSEDLQEYIETLKLRTAKSWQIVPHFTKELQSSFPMIKAIGRRKEFETIKEKVLDIHPLEFVIVQDPKRAEYDYLLVTDVKASKGNALKYFINEFSLKGPIIAAGDDENDLSFLKLSDIKIVMENAPKELKSIATIHAPLSKYRGIIQGLNEAIQCQI